MINVNERQKAEFNYAVDYLRRINTWFYSAGMSAYDLDPYGWFHSLMNIFRELSTFMSEDEINSFNDKIEKINEMLVKNRAVGKNKGKYISNSLYLELHKFELKLRKIMDKSGLQMRYSEDGMDALR